MLVFGGALYLARRYPRGPQTWRDGLVAAVGAIVGGALILAATDTPWFGDYQSAYYPAGQLILTDPQQIYGKECAFGFVNLPLVALPFVPFSMLSYTGASLVFTLVGLIMIVWAWFAAVRSEAIGARDAGGRVFALFVISGPLWYSVCEANLTHFLLVPLIVALGCLTSGRQWLGGAIVGLAAVIKLPLVLFFGYFVARLQFRAALGFAAAVGGTVVLSLLIYGLPLHQQWLDSCIFPYAGKPVGAFNVQSLTAFLARFYGANTYNWTPQPIGGSFPIVQRVLSLGLAATVAAVLLRAGRPRTRKETAVEFSIVLVFVLLFSPLSWTHYFLFVLLPLAIFAAETVEWPRGRAWMLAGAFTVFTLSLPLRGFSNDNPTLRFIYDRFLASHHFYGGVVLLAGLLWVRLTLARTPAERSH